MIILLVLGLCLLVCCLAVGWLYWFFIGTEPAEESIDVGDYYWVKSQPFYGEVVQVIEVDNKDYPDGVKCKGHSKDSNRVVEVWLNKELLHPLDELWDKPHE